LKVGDKVEAQFKGGKEWFAAWITAVNRDGTYDLGYDDGDKEASVPWQRVRKPEARQTPSTGAEEEGPEKAQVSPTNRGVLGERWEERPFRG
jgi:hypothetical protein